MSQKTSAPVKKITFLALFTTLSLAVYAIESAVPPLVPIPGIKLGLANIITLILLRHYSVKDAVIVLLSRILLSALLFGQALSLLYSLSGGLLSLLLMALIMRLLQKNLIFLTGAMGGLAHNMGQLALAYAVTSTKGVLSYAPFLIISGILTGLFTGFCAGFLGKYLPPRPMA
ncbi:MAG: Gx transporter family protein [Lachnospiraceae bacterium]|nr:Gx transporter family protein [uncultured Acetatifactor sp.]MCI8286611.1 Gx transporter family protein [Lachnospiraceae bacterium]